MRNRKRRRRAGLSIIGLLLLIICGTVTVMRLNQEKAYDSKLSQYTELEQQLKDEKDRSRILENERAYTRTKGYIEDVAREKFGLVYKDDTIYQPED